MKTTNHAWAIQNKFLGTFIADDNTYTPHLALARLFVVRETARNNIKSHDNTKHEKVVKVVIK